MFKFARKAVLKVTNIIVPDSETQIVRLIARYSKRKSKNLVDLGRLGS